MKLLKQSLSLFVLLLTFRAVPVLAEDRSFYSPVIYIDTEKSQILISTSATVFYIEVPDAAKPHMEKLPISGLVDFVVEMRGVSDIPLEERAEIAFVMDMQDFSTAKKDMRNNGLDLQVVYHSHPHDPARPSVTDIKIATDYEEIWPKINLPLPSYLIVSLMNAEPDAKTYWIKSGQVTPAEITIR